MQPLQLAFRHRVEVDAPNALLSTRAPQPTKENLGSAGIRDRALAQTTLDLGVSGRLTLTARRAMGKVLAKLGVEGSPEELRRIVDALDALPS